MCSLFSPFDWFSGLPTIHHILAAILMERDEKNAAWGPQGGVSIEEMP